MKKLLVMVSLFLAGCVSPTLQTPWRLGYLREGKGKISQDDVLLKMGPPHSTRKTSDNREVWLYQYTNSYLQSVPDYAAGGHHIMGGSNCAEYIVVFNASVLSDFTRQGC
jgi:hypothetical protein